MADRRFTDPKPRPSRPELRRELRAWRKLIGRPLLLRALDAPADEAPARLTRRAALELEAKPDDKAGQLVRLSFSSEEPVRRVLSDGTIAWEVLGHDEGEIDLGYFNAGAVPVLKEHDHHVDAMIGRVEEARVEGGRGVTMVRLFATGAGAEMSARVRAGEVKSVSVGYEVDRYARSGRRDGLPVMRAVRWTPRELSLVAIPADPTVGIGRSVAAGGGQPLKRDFPMPEQQTTTRPDEAATTTSTPAKGALEERRRIGEITAIARQFDVPAADVSAAIEDGTTIDQFRRMTMELIQLRSRSSGPNFAGATRIAIQQERAEPYSLVRAVAAQVSDDWAEAGFEREVGEELRRIRGRAGRGALRPGRGPGEARPPHHGERRGADRHRAPRQPVRRRPAPGGAGDGARRHGADGPARDVSIPRQLTGTQAEWIAEDAAAAETQPTFDSVGLTLKQFSARSPLGRRQLKQSLPALDELLRNDLRRQIAIALDAAAINGAGGALEPLGILGTPGIGSLPLGDDGARSPGRAWSA